MSLSLSRPFFVLRIVSTASAKSGVAASALHVFCCRGATCLACFISDAT
jgi:hypothetical protein